MTQFKNYTIIYEFKHSKMGFSSQITVSALTTDQAIENAKREISAAYGSKMFPRFTFKLK